MAVPDGFPIYPAPLGRPKTKIGLILFGTKSFHSGDTPAHDVMDGSGSVKACMARHEIW